MLVQVDTLEEALALLEDWARAYARLQWEHDKALRELEHARAAIAFDEAARKAEEFLDNCPF